MAKKTEDKKKPRSSGAKNQYKNEQGRNNTKRAHGGNPVGHHQDPPRDNSRNDGEYAIQDDPNFKSEG